MLPEDLKTLEQKGISPEAFNAQIKRFETGFPYLRILDSARVGCGIISLDDAGREKAVARWDEYLSHGGQVFKFVPASGAASRMFKALFEFLDAEANEPAEGSAMADFFKRLPDFAFYAELDAVCQTLYGKDIPALLDGGEYKKIVAALLGKEGMNYGSLPKGLLKFHLYADGARTPLEEHLVEGAQTATDSQGVVNLHFTVSPEHRTLFEAKIAEAVPALEKKLGVKYNISLSEQKKSTEYKKVIAGYLIEVHDKIEEYMRKINAGDYTMDDVREMISFMHDTLNLRDDAMKNLEDVDLVLYIKNKLNRPIRVCGMVRNEGEPGGGPYIAYNPDGSTSPQILESTQIDPANSQYKEMVARATHFNPVDLVCFLKDVDGNKFDLPRYVDPDTGFISSKSRNGKELRALELPGLWNGAMSDWNTVFIEVPIGTFNPVKTVNDLLRPAHQG